MNDGENRPDDPSHIPSEWERELRRKAEDLVSKDLSDGMAPGSLSPSEIREKLLELRACQVELDLYKDALRAARAEVEDNRKRSGDFYDLAPVGYCTLSEDGLILDANRAAADMLGTPLSALVNQPMARFVHEDDRAICRQHCQRLFHAGDDEADRFDVRIVRPDGAVCWTSISAPKARPVEPSRRGDGEGAGAICHLALTDISERKRIEQDLRNSEEKYRSLVENLNEILYVLNMKAEVEYVSPNIERISGYSASEVVGRRFLEFVHPEDMEGRIESFQASLAGQNLVTEYRMLTKHGDIRWARTQARPIFEGGKPVGVQGLLLDITEEKQMAEALRESEERFRTLFREAPVSILVHDKDTGEIVDANEKACAAYGLASVDDIRRHTIWGDPPYSIVEAVSLIQKAATEGPQSVEWMSRKVTGEAFWEQVNLRLVNLDGVPRVLAIAVDITKRKQAEAELRQYDWIMEAVLASGDREEAADAEDYGDLTRLNTSRVILDALGKESLASMATDVMALLDTSLAVYERNGDYAYAVFQSAWCRLLDTATFRLCGTDDVREALECGKWICHENCWNGATRKAIESGKPVDIKCAGGINLYAVPVFAGDETVGAVSIGYGNPPKNDETLRKLASRLNVGFDDLRAKAWAYKPRPEFIIELGKRRCQYMAYMIGETVERKRATEDLRHAKDQFESLVTNIPGVTLRCAFDEAWTVLYASEALEPLTGYPASDFILNAARAYDSVIHHDDAGWRKERIRKAIAADKPWGLEYRVCRRDGSLRWVQERGRGIRSSDGAVAFLDGFVLDITERKEAEASLNRLGAAIEQAGEIIVITDPDGTIQYVNPAFAKVTGYSQEDALGQNPRILKSGEQDEAFYREMWDTLASGRVWEGQFINKRKDGTFYTEDANISPVTDASGRLVNYVAVKRDISEHLQLSARLQQAQKLESIGRLAGGVAHDFNNLLTGISGFAQLAFKAAPEESDSRADLREVLGLSERAANLTRQLLAFSRRQALDPTVFNVNDLLEDLTKMLGRLIGENIEIRLHTAPDLGNVRADPSQIEQIIMNLAVNARDAMPDGGRLTIETANMDLDNNYQETHAVVVPGPYVMLSVSDNGSGMDEETREHLFEPFYTTKKLGDGTGLGLPMVYGIVKQHGGNIWVYSEPDKGTTFKVYLPRVLEEAETGAFAVSDEPQQGTGTILVVEDEESVRRVAARWLEGMGYRVLSVASPAEAEDVLAEQGGEISLMLTDVVLPERDGRQLYESASREWPHLRVLYMSGYTDNAIVHHGVLDEGIPFLQKPFTAEALGRKVGEALGAHNHDD